MIKAAEHHAATGQRLQGRKTKTLTHPTTTPKLGRVIEINLGAVEQLHKVIDPAALDLYSQSLRLQGRHQLIQHIGTAFTKLHQYIDRPLRAGALRCRTGARPPVDPVRFESIGHQKQWITGRTISPITEGVSTNRNHWHSWRKIKSIATAMSLIHHISAAQTLQRTRNIKPPTHDPKSCSWRRLIAKQIVKERLTLCSFPISDNLCEPQRGQQASGLQGHVETTATKTGSGARHQNPNGGEPP